MKATLFTLVVLLSCVCAQTAQADLATMHGKVYNASNVPLSGAYSVIVRIYNAGGGLVFMETHPAVLFTSGNFTMSIGSLTYGGVPTFCFDGTHSCSISIPETGLAERWCDFVADMELPSN